MISDGYTQLPKQKHGIGQNTKILTTEQLHLENTEANSVHTSLD
jgi:hypothetical protein